MQYNPSFSDPIQSVLFYKKPILNTSAKQCFDAVLLLLKYLFAFFGLFTQCGGMQEKKTFSSQTRCDLLIQNGHFVGEVFNCYACFITFYTAVQ